jgi:hypothetical protein
LCSDDHRALPTQDFLLKDEEIACLPFADYVLRQLPAGPMDFDLLRLGPVHAKKRPAQR